MRRGIFACYDISRVRASHFDAPPGQPHNMIVLFDLSLDLHGLDKDEGSRGTK